MLDGFSIGIYKHKDPSQWPGGRREQVSACKVSNHITSLWQTSIQPPGHRLPVHNHDTVSGKKVALTWVTSSSTPIFLASHQGSCRHTRCHKQQWGALPQPRCRYQPPCHLLLLSSAIANMVVTAAVTRQRQAGRGQGMPAPGGSCWDRVLWQAACRRHTNPQPTFTRWKVSGPG